MTETISQDRVPPYEEAAERSLLGSLLLNAENCGVLIPMLGEQDFYLPSHRKIFRAIQQLYEESKPIDAVLVREQLQREDGNGISPDYLVTLLEAVPSSAHAEHYAQIIREKAKLREIIAACTRILKECYSQAGHSEQLIDQAGQILLEISLRHTTGESVKIHEVLQDLFDKIEALRRGQVSGLRTGFHQLDQMTSGLQDSDLVIIAGRPGMGKTSYALNIAANVAIEQRAPVAIFSLEVSKLQLGLNLLCAQARVNAHQVRTGQINEYMMGQLFHAVGRLAEAPLFIQDTPSLSVAELRAQCRQLKNRHGLKAVFIDYLQLMEGSRQLQFDGREREISYISRNLKSLARELQVPIVVLSQLNRSVENREGNRPRMADLRESGSLEQDADVILLLYREGYYRQEEDRTAEVIIAKQRNGPTGTVRLIFNQEYLRFDNPTAEDNV
ncbi:MAG: replicative DNA helicase [Planctomycetes bacterium]|nr:replicative DNA helicase [Planctomycetota bacterium]